MRIYERRDLYILPLGFSFLGPQEKKGSISDTKYENEMRNTL